MTTLAPWDGFVSGSSEEESAALETVAEKHVDRHIDKRTRGKVGRQRGNFMAGVPLRTFATLQPSLDYTQEPNDHGLPEFG
jgi:hypothetical protein